MEEVDLQVQRGTREVRLSVPLRGSLSAFSPLLSMQIPYRKIMTVIFPREVQISMIVSSS